LSALTLGRRPCSSITAFHRGGVYNAHELECRPPQQVASEFSIYIV
jgi:hypothetical protein